MKHNDDQSVKRKAIIAPHGNEDNIKDSLTKDCTSSPPTAIRTVQYIATLNRRKLVCGDFKPEFLKKRTRQKGRFMYDHHKKVKCETEIYVKSRLQPVESYIQIAHGNLTLTRHS